MPGNVERYRKWDQINFIDGECYCYGLYEQFTYSCNPFIRRSYNPKF